LQIADETMRARRFICGIVATLAITLTETRAADPNFSAVTTEAAAIAAIEKCLLQGMEVVMLPVGVKCEPYRSGTPFLAKEEPNAPFNFDSERDCSKTALGSFNARRLSGDTIRRLAGDLKLNTGSPGIRVLGAIFCEKVTLVGLELPFSLVLDKSAFARGIEVRNVQIKGDFSLDGSLVLEQLRVIRSHIEGSFFADNSFIQKLSVGTSTIDRSASFSESVLFDNAQIYNATIASELSVRGSALSYFVTQFSHIGEALDLSHSEARCAYHINKSEIGYLVARRAGFGTVDRPIESQKVAGYYFWRDNLTPAVGRILAIPEIHKLVERGDTCANTIDADRPYRAQFYVFDSIIKSSLCINEFRWLAPRDAGPYTSEEFFRPREGTDRYLRTTVAVNGNTIGNNLIIDLWPQDDGEEKLDYKVSPSLHKFEVIGVKAGGLIINFKDPNQDRVITAVDGLQFERLYNGRASCEYGGSRTAPPIYEDRTLSIISDFNEALELPKVEDALKWLDLNTIGSTQPYAAFATAFKNAGVDGAPISIARKNRELCERATRWLPLAILRRTCDGFPKRQDAGAEDSSHDLGTKSSVPRDDQDGWRRLGSTIFSIPTQLSDLALLGFQGALYFLADHGYRPGKVFWWATLALVGFWLWFLWPLKVIAYSSKAQPSTVDDAPPDNPRIRPLGILFLFDRLLPAYQIDDAHYQIESYFKRIPVSKIGEMTPTPPLVRRLFFFQWPVERVVDRRELDRIDNSLLILRLLGVVFAVFLAAAISALVVR
jgi:hypothetical protein